jgi:hypothetical protein
MLQRREPAAVAKALQLSSTTDKVAQLDQWLKQQASKQSCGPESDQADEAKGSSRFFKDVKTLLVWLDDVWASASHPAIMCGCCSLSDGLLVSQAVWCMSVCTKMASRNTFP